VLAAPLALAAAVALGSSPPPAPASAPWEGEPFGADPRAMAAAAEALAPPRGVAAEILLEEGTFRFQATGASTFTYRLVARAVTADAARALGRLERTWSPWHQARPEVRVRVVSPGGEVAELDPATLTEQGVGGEQLDRFSDRRALVAPLPGVRAGSIIEEVTTVRDTAPAFEGGVTARFWFGRAAPARLVRLRLEAPASLPLRWVVRGVRARPLERSAGGVRTITFEQRDVPQAPRPEPAAPPELPAAPHVAFGWGKSWADVAERYGAVVERQLAGADLGEAVQEALGGAPGASRPDLGREETVRRIAAWVWGRVRYTGLELGEAAIVPARPADTLQRRYGDCKDLSLVMAGMLRAAGLPARLVLLSTEWNDLTAELPGLGELDHVVLKVEGGPPIWLDATDPGTPPGRLPPAIQGKLALVAGTGTRDLVRTPVSGPADNTALTERELHLAPIGKGRVVETRTLTGALADGERRFRQQAGPDLDERYAREVFRAETFLGAVVERTEDTSRPFQLRIEADDCGALFTEDDEADVPANPDAVFQPLLSFVPHGDETGAPQRTQPLVLPLPYRWEVRYRVFPPDGFRPRPLPAGGVERFGPATYTRRFEQAPDGSLTASYVLDTGGRRLSAADASALLGRAREVVGGQGPRLRLERTAAALLAAGQVVEGLAELRRLAAAHPRDAAHRLHLAVALLQLGFGETAAATAREGIALEPRRAWGHRVLGYVLEHDAVGRLHGPGFDRDGALAAYQRARQLDATHLGGRAALADLLATDDDGVRHGPGADLAAAIEEYRSIREQLQEKGQDAALLAAYVSAGRFPEALALARESPAGPERNALLVAAVAASEGPEKAAAEADGLGEGRRDALRGAAPWLVRLRRFPAAAAVLREAARGAQNAAELRGQADDFAAVRPFEAARKVGDEAERLVKQLFVVALTERDPAAKLTPLLSPRVLASDLGDVLRGGLPLPVAAARQTLRQTGIPRDALLDIVLSRMETAREGELDKVLRLRLRFPFSAAERGSIAYLTREGGAVRLLATDLAWPVLADEALRLAATGDLAVAARLVTWAREDAGADPDPASPGALLAPLWRPGSGDAAPSRESVQRAARVLVAFADRKGRTLPALEAARAAAPDGPERRALALAVIRAARSAGRPADVLRVADALLAEDPASRPGFAAKAWALQRLGRREELSRAGQAMLARLPGDAGVLSALGGAQLLAGDLDGASATWRALIDSGQASPVAYNNAAWLELFLGGAGPPALDWARRAVDQDRDRNRASLNTLAAVYASLDRPAEAREIFLRSLGEGRPLAGADWFVAGRIAEGWGLTEAARSAYLRVKAEPVDGEPDPTDAHILAERRLGALPPAAANP
jgi:transglutaminase-like putative cysteine protease/tetratricopeptide (TPR) repeat protein